MFKFRSHNPEKPKKPKITNKHILGTRQDNPKKTRKKHKPYKKHEVERTPVYLSTKVSENYEGKVEGIIAYIKDLPAEIKILLDTNEVETVVARQGYTMYKLNGGITVKITETKLGNKHKLYVEIKFGKKRLISNYI